MSWLVSAGSMGIPFTFVEVATANCAALLTLLLKAGHPLHPSAPPVPLHLPPPGQVPEATWSAAT